MNLKPMITERFHQTWKIYAIVFIPMWCMFVLNSSILFGIWNTFGIQPRELELLSIIGIALSWTMHANLAHIVGNSLLLLQILFVFALFEKNVFKTICMLVLGSGVATWLLGSDNSNHVGASGLAFAMLGFMVGGALFAKRWGYLVASVIMGTSFWMAVVKGLIPQQGISFAGHFGGLVVGLVLGAKSQQTRFRS